MGQSIVQLQAGRSPPRKQGIYAAVDRAIERLVDGYPRYKEAGDEYVYMKAIGHNLAPRLSRLLELDEDNLFDECEENECQPPLSKRMKQAPSDDDASEEENSTGRPFRPPTVTWQKNTCQRLYLEFRKASGLRGAKGYFRPTSPPFKDRQSEGRWGLLLQMSLVHRHWGGGGTSALQKPHLRLNL